MTRTEYLHQLRVLLRALPNDEVERIVGFYEETIDDHMEAGESEDEAVVALEAPGTVATRLIEEMAPIPRVITKTRGRSRVLFWALVILGSPIWLSLAFAGILAAAALYVVLWALVLAAWLCTLALIAGLPVGIVAACFAAGMQAPAFAFVQLGTGAALSGVGLLCLHLSLAITRGIVKATAALTRKIVALFVNRFHGEGLDDSGRDGGGHAPCAPPEVADGAVEGDALATDDAEVATRLTARVESVSRVVL